FFLLIAVIVYLQSPLSHIKTINVNQNDVLSDEEIIKESGLKINTNIWMYKKGKTIKSLETHPMIETATIHRSLPSTVEIKIKKIREVILLTNALRTYASKKHPT